MKLKPKTQRTFELLAALYPEAQTELHYSDPFQLLVATILSAQCTDARVNQVTKVLFGKIRTPCDFARCSQKRLEEIIRPTGFFRQKAKSIRGAAAALVEHHAGRVPQTMEELIALPGVGRKTANVVLGNAFGTPGLAVDTHVRRLAQRIGLSSHSDPEKIEADLTALLPPTRWTLMSHLLISHGRRVCKARKPICERCPLRKLCNHYQKAARDV